MTKPDIEWIKHRRPTELDGDASGDVLTRDGLVYYTEVISGVEWIRVPEMSKKDDEIKRLRGLLERVLDTIGRTVPSRRWYPLLLEIVVALEASDE